MNLLIVFTLIGVWELCKLGQVANYRRGSFPQPYGNKEWYDGENSMPFVQVVDVGDNLRLVEDTKQKISELAQPKSVFVKEGKVVVTLQGSIGRVAITQYPAYVDRTLLIFESYKAEMDEYYFAYVIQQLFEYEKTRAPGGTIKTVTKEALSDFTISFPSIEEQKKLGKFFEQLDDTITLHQRKLDQLKKLKKAYLQAMFVSTNPKNNKVPKLRFTDFEGDWELCKLGELIESFDSERIPIDSSLRISGQYPYYGATGIIDYIDSYIFDGEYVLLAEDGANIIMRNYPVAYLTQGKFWLNNHAHIMRMVKGDNQFLVQILEKMNYSKYNTGTAQPKLNSNIVKRINLRVPIPEEQQKIGTIFKQLDDTITLHQRKLDQLKELKKAYLQLMFPKKDETVPRVRFADFEDDWQLCKLGDVVEIFDGTHQTPRYTDSGVKFVSVENIATLETKKYITHEAYEKEYSKKRAKKGDILMTRIGDIGTMKVIETDEPLAYYVTLALLKAKETNPYFLSFIISSPEIQRNIWKRTLHIAFPKKINLGEINQVEMKITIFEEQDKIGDLFTNLDDAIILNQNKLNQLKSLKKSYLQNMFI